MAASLQPRPSRYVAKRLQASPYLLCPGCPRAPRSSMRRSGWPGKTLRARSESAVLLAPRSVQRAGCRAAAQQPLLAEVLGARRLQVRLAHLVQLALVAPLAPAQCTGRWAVALASGGAGLMRGREAAGRPRAAAPAPCNRLGLAMMIPMHLLLLALAGAGAERMLGKAGSGSMPASPPSPPPSPNGSRPNSASATTVRLYIPHARPQGFMERRTAGGQPHRAVQLLAWLYAEETG